MQEDQASVLRALLSPEAYPHETGTIEVIETHISHVFLTGRFAYKVKKAVKLPYLDFSSLECRERACRDELRLNRRNASALYHEVVGIGGSSKRIHVGGTPTIEFAVKMTQFPRGATANELIRDDALSGSDLVGLAGHLAEFHDSLPPSPEDGSPDRMLANLAELEAEWPDAGQGEIGAVARWLRSEIRRLAPILQTRAARGYVRECHGDLHLGNIVRWQGELIPFDCLEFSRALRTIDVIDEAAFLFMDLIAHARPDLAFAFLNRYLERTGDYDSLRLLRLYIVHRALVRAKVAIASPRPRSEAHAAESPDRYLAAAAAQTRQPKPFCAITNGLSGSGKTTIASRLAPKLGAVHVRSDVERKRLHGMKPTDESHSGIGQGIYEPVSSETTYRHLAAVAESALSGGFDVIVDASFLSRRERNRFHALATRLGARFLILACTAPDETLRHRIVERNETRRDASEADIAVLEHQKQSGDRLGEDEAASALTLNTKDEIDIDRLVAGIAARMRQPSSSSTSY